MSSDPSNHEGYQILQRVAAEALADDGYRQRLIANPNKELTDAGLTVPEGTTVSIHQNTETEVHLVLPSTVGGQPPLDVDDKNVRSAFSVSHLF